MKRQTALLVVVDPLTEQSASAKELTGMSVVHVRELRDWLSRALSMEATAASSSTN